VLSVTLACVGKLKEGYLRDACAEYSKRLKTFCKLNIIEVAESHLPEDPSDAQIAAGLSAEGKRLLGRIPGSSRIIAMCVEGRQRSSNELARDIEAAAMSGQSSLAFVIGGSWGLAPEVKQAADLQLSVSRMTFPHQLMRVLLLEQVYRAFQISHGGKYHK
jgi:23S rRNA (pseudouridine1915-N3)-methyltransferase